MMEKVKRYILLGIEHDSSASVQARVISEPPNQWGIYPLHEFKRGDEVVDAHAYDDLRDAKVLFWTLLRPNREGMWWFKFAGKRDAKVIPITMVDGKLKAHYVDEWDNGMAIDGPYFSGGLWSSGPAIQPVDLQEDALKDVK